MKLSFNKYGWIALLGAGLVSSPAATVGISVDTSNLLFGTYALQFQLTNGNAAGVNSVTLSGFNFGGGSPSGAPALIGGASGNLSSTVTLVDILWGMAVTGVSATVGYCVTARFAR